LHRFALILAAGTFLLIIAGALVTSNDAGLAVPDWPTSFGSLYRIPPMVGGVKFEHGHRMVAELIGLLTLAMALWTRKAEPRVWMRRLAWAALALVIAQGVVGGITVLFFLPWWISTAHATLAQTFFCVVVLIAVFTSRDWMESAAPQVVETRPLGLHALSGLTAGAIYLQLILGAAFRHSGIKLLPHLLMAAVVTGLVIWTAAHIFTVFHEVSSLRNAARLLLATLLIQLALGFGAYLTRVEWNRDAPQPMLSMVVTTVAHVAVGALLLATAVVVAAQAWRHLAGRGQPLWAAPEQATLASSPGLQLAGDAGGATPQRRSMSA